MLGAWCSDPGTHVLSFGFVSGFGHSRSMFCLFVGVWGLELARPHTLLSTCVLLCCTQFVFLSAVCIHVISCAVWHAACGFIGCLLSCCHVLCEHVVNEFSHYLRVCVLFCTWPVNCLLAMCLCFCFV